MNQKRNDIILSIIAILLVTAAVLANIIIRIPTLTPENLGSYSVDNLPYNTHTTVQLDAGEYEVTDTLNSYPAYDEGSSSGFFWRDYQYFVIETADSNGQPYTMLLRVRDMQAKQLMSGETITLEGVLGGAPNAKYDPHIYSNFQDMCFNDTKGDSFSGAAGIGLCVAVLAICAALILLTFKHSQGGEDNCR